MRDTKCQITSDVFIYNFIFCFFFLWTSGRTESRWRREEQHDWKSITLCASQHKKKTNTHTRFVLFSILYFFSIFHLLVFLVNGLTLSSSVYTTRVLKIEEYTTTVTKEKKWGNEQNNTYFFFITRLLTIV
jgi:hypothetical protein